MDSIKQNFSFEIFPPKATTDLANISRVIEQLCELSPDYISVTYGAGGSTNENHTVEICKLIKKISSIRPVAHLTCIGANKGSIDAILSQLLASGVNDILALRGDKPVNVTLSGEFSYASELVEYIQNAYPNTFNISCACYPTGHNESLNQKEDIFALRNKANKGVSQLITQMFFDNNEFYKFKELCDMAEISTPIHAGIMPLTNIRQLEKIIKMSGATIPARLSKLIARYGDNDTAMKDAGIAFATEQIIDLLASGVAGVHLYTMNNAEVATRIKNNISTLL
ncbi:MAG: methylenetetrahydrofolate reductase [NAD(P)H] [Clostridia bacterium]